MKWGFQSASILWPLWCFRGGLGSLKRLIVSWFSIKQAIKPNAPHVREFTVIAGFWIPRRGFRITVMNSSVSQWNLDSGFQSLVWFRNPWAVFRIPKLRILDSGKISRIPKSGFPYIGRNRPFPSSHGPLFQSEGRCSAFDMEIIFHSHANKTHFNKKGCAPSLILKVRVFGTRK